MDMYIATEQAYKNGYTRGVVDVLSILLEEYDEYQHAMVLQRDAVFSIAKILGVDLVKEIKEERYKLAAKRCGCTVEQLKAIDTEGPQCEVGLPVYECVLQKCEHLEHCHFKIKE